MALTILIFRACEVCHKAMNNSDMAKTRTVLSPVGLERWELATPQSRPALAPTWNIQSRGLVVWLFEELLASSLIMVTEVGEFECLEVDVVVVIGYDDDERKAD